MITGRQIRAARGILRWSAVSLAEKAGLTRETINKIEDDLVQPREGTMEDIVRVFGENGVEFIDNSGVRLKPQGVEILVGKDGLCQFFDDVYEHARKHGGTIMQFGVDENLFWVMEDYSPFHRKRMADLAKERKDLKVLAILCEGDTKFIAAEYNQYRWVAKEAFAPVPFYIYGERLAIMDFQTVPGPTIIVHKFPSIANAYRKQFEVWWKLARIPESPDIPAGEKKNQRRGAGDKR